MRLSVGAVLGGALLEIRANARALLLALSAPALIIASIDVLRWRDGEWGIPIGMLASVVQLFLYALFAVSCHRIILLGSKRLPNRWGIYALPEVWRYALVLLGIFVFVMLSSMLLIPLTMPIFMALDGPGTTIVIWVLVGLFLLALLALMGRVIPLLPALAIDSGHGFSDVLDMTRPCWMRIAAVLMISTVATSLVSMPLLWMAEASTGFFHALMPTFVGSLIGVYGVAVISVTFRELTRADAEPDPDAEKASG